MRAFIIISAFLVTLCQTALAQSALISALPKVEVKISVLENNYKSFDSVRFEMTITSLSDSIQSVLFDRPYKNYPWGTFVILTSNENGDTLSAYVNREVLSSTLYSEKELRKMGAFYNLSPKQSLKQTYLLTDVVILKNYDRAFKPGQYHFFLRYYMNQSNEVTFIIK